MALVRMFMQLALVVTLAVALGGTANAAYVAGNLNFGGTAVVSLFGLDFIPPVNGGDGTVWVLPGNTGTFAPIPAGSTGTIKDRTEAEQPVDTPLNIPNYLTLGNLEFTLTYIAPGSYPSTDCFAAPEAGQVCTLPPLEGAQSPYNFSNYLDATNGLSSYASFAVRGTVRDTTTPDLISNFNGVFTSTFLGKSYQENLATVFEEGGAVTAPFSASFTATPIPEPSTAVLIIAGAALIFAGRRARS